MRPCQGGGGGPMSPIWILKCLVSQFGRRRLSLVAISFYALSLLFGPCRLSEFTLARPHKNGGDNIFQNAEQKRCDVNYNYLDMCSNCSKFISEVRWEIWLHNLVVTYFQERIVIGREVHSLVSIHWGFSLLDGNGLNVALDGVHYLVVYVMIIIYEMLVDWNLKNFWKKDLGFEQANSPENPGKNIWQVKKKANTSLMGPT